jgi:hypothetical protein
MESELIKNLFKDIPGWAKSTILILLGLQLFTITLKKIIEVFPVRASKKQKNELIDEYLTNPAYIDGRLELHLKELKAREVFYKMTRIDCKKNLREGLIWFYESTSSYFSWSFIRSAKPYFKEKDGELFIEIPLIEEFWQIVNYIQSISCLIFAGLLYIIYSFLKTKTIGSTLIFFIAVFWFIASSLYFLSLTSPVGRARLINRQLNKLNNSNKKASSFIKKTQKSRQMLSKKLN